MADESVKVELFGISTGTVEDDRTESVLVVEVKPQKELELVAERDGEPVKVAWKDVGPENSEAPARQDGVVWLSNEGAGGAVQRTEGGTEQSELELVAEGGGEPAKVALNDVGFGNSEAPAGDDGVGVTNEGAGGAEQETEGATDDSESPALEEEEQEECGFCLFMKAGPCGERFTIWQNCVDAAEKSNEDIVEKCAQTTSLLKVCMEMNLDYYGPVLEAEKAMEGVASQDESQVAEGA